VDRKASVGPTVGSSDEVFVFFMAKGEGIDVCGGCIGSDNSKFCTMPCTSGGSTCGRYVKHGRKAGVAHPGFYISSVRPGVAFLQPRLLEPDGGFSPSVARVLTGSRTQEDWIGIFSAFAGIELLPESDQQDIVSRVSRLVSVAPTPMRLRKKSAIEDLAQIVADNPGGEQLNVTEEEDWEEELRLEEGESVDAMMEKWNVLIRATKRNHQNMADVESNVRGLLEEIDDKVVKVAAVVGSRKKVNAPAMTIWASIGAHSDLLDSHSLELTDVKGKFDNEFDDLVSKVTEVNDVLNGKVFPVVAHLTTRIEDIQTGGPGSGENSDASRKIQQLRSRQDVLATELQKVIARLDATAGDGDLEAFRVEVLAIQRNQIRLADAVQSLQANHNEGGSPGSDAELTVLKEAIGRIQDDMSVLRLENRRLHAALNSDSFSFGGHFFHTEETYDAFVTTHLPSGYYGYSLDFISLLECYEDANRTSSDGLKNTYTVAKAGYDDVQEARIDHSFGCTFPAIFGAPQETSNPSKKMALFTTSTVWHDPGNNSGVKKDIDIFMSGFEASVESEIYSELGHGTPASLFFVAMFHNTYTFWQRYSAWITKMIDEKMNQIGMSNKEAHMALVWNQICWMTYAMFIEMAKRRKAGTGNKKVGNSVDKKKKCVRVLKGTLGAHKFMKELMDQEFEKHPIFAATTSEFILKNMVTMISHNDLATRVKKSEETSKSAQATADKAFQATRKGAPANPK
jgi:hypothetical protein